MAWCGFWESAFDSVLTLVAWCGFWGSWFDSVLTLVTWFLWIMIWWCSNPYCLLCYSCCYGRLGRRGLRSCQGSDPRPFRTSHLDPCSRETPGLSCRDPFVWRFQTTAAKLHSAPTLDWKIFSTSYNNLFCNSHHRICWVRCS